MSRSVELLEESPEAMDQMRFKALIVNMLERLYARSGTIEMHFSYFARKSAPVSRVQSLLDHEVCWRASVSTDGRYAFSMRVTVPATSLYLCSKEISAHSAHNQRSYISIEAELLGEMAIEELIVMAERSASCEVYGLLKRVNEKYVTERAYGNPEFLEDLVRDVALLLNQEQRVGAYSIASAPFQDERVIATRMRDSPCKCALSALSNGTLVKLDGPFGSLTLHNIRARPAVFIAGGIGITPFMSILRQATKDQLPQRMILLYSNHRPEDAAFLVELQQLARENSNLQLSATMTKMEKSRTPWDGRTGPIDEHLVIKVCGKLPAPICYLVGPPGMVASMRETLSEAGVNDDDIRSEEFYGY